MLTVGAALIGILIGAFVAAALLVTSPARAFAPPRRPASGCSRTQGARRKP